MADLTVTAANVKPLPQSIFRDFTAGGSGNVGDSVYLDSAGKVQQTAAGAAGTTNAIGVVISVTDGKTAFVSGDRVSVVMWGPVNGFSSLTPGGKAYVSNTAGKLGDAAGTNTRVVGVALDAATVFIHHNWTAS